MKYNTAPISPSERILSLDVLRGFAIFGILIMNIQSFSMIEAAYINPTAFGDLSGLNKWVWILSHVFADSKFMTLFSILFGAGILLFANKIESKGFKPAGLHYSRTFWLLIIGLIHAYFLWYGDILVTYALCALFIFLLRKLAPKRLLVIGIIIFSIPSLLYLFFGWIMQYWPQEAVDNSMVSWFPAQNLIDQEIAAYHGSWSDQMSHRIPAAIFLQTFIFLMWYGWRAAGLMLIGMALYKWGVLTAQKSNRVYVKFTVTGFVIGFLLVIWGIIKNFAVNWSFDFSMFLGWQFNYWGSVFVVLGYIGVIMLVSKSVFFEKITRPLAAVGRTALTNYLAQTIICTLIFYGHGLGLYAKVERKEQILFVFGIWLVQLIISTVWLRRFRFGPAEWIWHSLTYLKIQPFRNPG